MVKCNLTETRKTPSKQFEKQTENIIPTFFNKKTNETPTESITRTFRSSSTSKNPSNADQAIKRWKEKLLIQSQSNCIFFHLYFSFIQLIFLQKI